MNAAASFIIGLALCLTSLAAPVAYGDSSTKAEATATFEGDVPRGMPMAALEQAAEALNERGDGTWAAAWLEVGPERGQSTVVVPGHHELTHVTQQGAAAYRGEVFIVGDSTVVLEAWQLEVVASETNDIAAYSWALSADLGEVRVDTSTAAAKPESAYFVKCDRGTTTQSVEGWGVVNLELLGS